MASYWPPLAIAAEMAFRSRLAIILLVAGLWSATGPGQGVVASEHGGSAEAGPWTGARPEQDAEVSGDGQAVVELFAPGSTAEPAVSVSFDGRGSATVTSNVTSVRVREIVPVEDPADPNYRGACLQTRQVVVPIGQEDETAATYETVIEFTLRALFPEESPEVPACLPDEGDPGEADPARAFEEMLAPFVEQLPRPTPVLNPETAITGLDTYLETNRPLAHGPVAGQITLGGRDFGVTLWAEGVYRVDWGMAGDGEGPAFPQVSGPHAVPGRPFEQGRPRDAEAVTHVYTSVPDGPLSVSVTDYWNVHYSIDGVVQGATLVAELEPVSVPVQVRQYQAVVVSD